MKKAYSRPQAPFKPQYLKDPAVWFTSCGMIGFAPKASGTVASLVAGLAFLPLISWQVPSFFLSIFFVVTTFPTMLIVDYVEKKYHHKDPSWIVIDEFLGMLLAFIIASPQNAYGVFAIFIFFRFFDIVKPGPIGWIDRNVRNGIGNVCDDLLSGFFAGLIFYCFSALK